MLSKKNYVKQNTESGKHKWKEQQQKQQQKVL